MATRWACGFVPARRPRERLCDSGPSSTLLSGGRAMRPMSTSSLLVGTFATLAICISVFSACGGSDAPAPSASCTGACSCSGTTCTCNTGGTCDFGGVEADGAASGPVPNNVTYQCDSKNTCNATCGTGCTTTCDGQSTCIGTCESNCTSSCGGTSICTLTTGTNSMVTCEGGSTCNVDVDTGSTVTCTGNSICNVTCPKGGCTLSCQGSGTCDVTCGVVADAGTRGDTDAGTIQGADAGASGIAACKIDCGGGKSDTCAAGTTCTNTCGH